MKLTKKNSKFDLDLKYGQQREQRVADLLGADKNKIEVKTEETGGIKQVTLLLK